MILLRNTRNISLGYSSTLSYSIRELQIALPSLSRVGKQNGTTKVSSGALAAQLVSTEVDYRVLS